MLSRTAVHAQPRVLVALIHFLVQFRYSGKNPVRFAVFWRIFVRFCGFRTPLTPPPAPRLLQVFTLKNVIITVEHIGYRAFAFFFGKDWPRGMTID